MVTFLWTPSFILISFLKFVEYKIAATPDDLSPINQSMLNIIPATIFDYYILVLVNSLRHFFIIFTVHFRVYQLSSFSNWSLETLPFFHIQLGMLCYQWLFFTSGFKTFTWFSHSVTVIPTSTVGHPLFLCIISLSSCFQIPFHLQCFRLWSNGIVIMIFQFWFPLT